MIKDTEISLEKCISPEGSKNQREDSHSPDINGASPPRVNKNKWKHFEGWLLDDYIIPLFTGCTLVSGSFVSGRGGECQLELVRPKREEFGKPREGEVEG
uniref:Uncharacterized protein n=1 Tax=Sphaerodactylus townsendi TaxID=933632 RepID=A0ACB8EJV9_9SAUR